MKLSILLISLLFAATGQAAPKCEKKTEVGFFADGKPVQSQLINSNDPCDDFGGNLVYTPKHKIYFYVNFNIAGTIDLDAVDRVIEPFLNKQLRRGGSKHYRDLNIAVVTQARLKRLNFDHNAEDRDAKYSYNTEILFVADRVIKEGRLEKVLGDYFQLLQER